MTDALEELRYRRLLVAIDGSANADLALAMAVTAARRDNASLAIVSVAPDVSDVSRWGTTIDVGRLQDDADAETQATLRRAVDRIPGELPVTTIFRRGKAGPEIVALANGGGYDAVMLGARGVGRVGALLGSVSGHVLHHADVAVFVAHAPREADADAT